MKKLVLLLGLLAIVIAVVLLYTKIGFFEKVRYRPPQVPDQFGLQEGFSLDTEPHFIYKSYDVKSENIIDQTFVTIKKLPAGKKAVRWSIKNDHYVSENGLYGLSMIYFVLHFHRKGAKSAKTAKEKVQANRTKRERILSYCRFFYWRLFAFIRGSRFHPINSRLATYT